MRKYKKIIPSLTKMLGRQLPRLDSRTGAYEERIDNICYWLHVQWMPSASIHAHKKQPTSTERTITHLVKWQDEYSTTASKN